MSESADARYVVSGLLVGFTGLSATLAALFASGVVGYVAPLVLLLVTLAHGFDQRTTATTQEVREQ